MVEKNSNNPFSPKNNFQPIFCNTYNQYIDRKSEEVFLWPHIYQHMEDLGKCVAVK